MFSKSNIIISATTLGLMGLVNAQTASTFDLKSLESYALNALVSQQCKTAIKTTFSAQSELGQCQFYNALVGIQDQTSLESYLNTMCSSAPCSEQSLKSASDNIWQGCSVELGHLGINQNFVNEAFGSYSLQREIACLKTEQDSNQRYCLSVYSSSIELSNLTFTTTTTISTSNSVSNSTSDSNAETETTAAKYICNNCVTASLDLIQIQYPELQSTILSQDEQGQGKTLTSWFNGVCGSQYTLSTDGNLPAGVNRTATASTFPNKSGVAKRLLRRNIVALRNRFLNLL